MTDNSSLATSAVAILLAMNGASDEKIRAALGITKAERDEILHDLENKED